MNKFGGDLRKWLICRTLPGRWIVCSPSASGRLLSDTPNPVAFSTGAEALAAFAAGGTR